MSAAACPSLLNTKVMAERRLALGMSQRTLAHLSGITPPTVMRMENEEVSPDFTLANLWRLAEALGIEPWELLRTANGGSPPQDDDKRVEAFLHETGRLTRREEIADAFDWPLARLNTALDALERRLAGTGVRLRRHPNGPVCLSPGPTGLTDEDRSRAARAALQHRGLNIRTGSILRRLVADGPIPLPANNNERVGAGELLTASLVEMSGNQLVITADCAFSLVLTD